MGRRGGSYAKAAAGSDNGEGGLLGYQEIIDRQIVEFAARCSPLHRIASREVNKDLRIQYLRIVTRRGYELSGTGS
jgi:hypothetical protein